MRFSFIIILLSCSYLFSQSTIFVKYKTDRAFQESRLKIESFLKAGNSASSSTLKKSDIKISSFSEHFGHLNSNLNKISRIYLRNKTDSNFLIDSIEADPNVEYVQISARYKIDYIPADSLFNQQWGLKSISAPEAWDLFPEKGEEIILAVIDTGIDYLHPDLINSIHFNEGEQGIDQYGNDKSNNGIDDDGNGFIDDYRGWDFVNKLDIFPFDVNDDFTDWDNDPNDEHGHGTNISGIVGAEHNSIGIAGANPNVKILNLRAFDKNGNGEEDDAASAIIYAVKMGAKVINMSWGDNVHSQLLKDVIEYAYDNNVLMVASAGNKSTDEPHFPSGFTEVISVGAIQENEALATFSNFGSTIDLVAPGSQIFTLGLNGSYKTVSGTSASAPFVSSTAALLVSVKDFSNEEIKQILKSTATDLGENGWDIKYGAGNLNMRKALTLLSPSEIKFNSPFQGLSTFSDTLNINITCISSYFKDFKLYFGVGNNPQNWDQLITGKENFQLYNENIFNLDLSNFQDTSYSIRLLVNKIDGNTLEERINFTIDRSPPKVLDYNFFPAMLNDFETLQASVITQKPTKVKLYYRIQNSNENFDFIFLDAFNRDIGNISNSHFGMLPENDVISGINHEFYFEVISQSGLVTIIKDGQNYFKTENKINIRTINNSEKDYFLPGGRIFDNPIKLNGLSENFVFLNENETSANLSIYKFFENQFEKVGELKNKIPVSVGDFDKNGKTDILNLFVKNGFIDSQIDIGITDFQNLYSDSSQSFWPAYADDIDNDNKVEIIVFSSDTTITIWEVQNDNNLIEEITLINFQKTENTNKSVFRNNILMVDDFDNDSKNEIAAIDNYGRLILYKINGNIDYSNFKVIEHFYPIESNSTFTKGDFNGDGKIDIAVLIEFEENVFQTPLIYSSVFSINSGNIEYYFQNMFITTETKFFNSFDKQYKAISFADINQNNKDELIIFTFPNSYIFEFDENPNLIFYQTNVNSQSIFVGDLDENGITEIGIPNGDKIFFKEFIEDDRIKPPLITDYYSLDSQQIYFEWSNNNNPVYITKIDEEQNSILYDSTNNGYYVDKVTPNTYNKYFINYYDKNSGAIISNNSKTIEVFAHAPGEVKNLIIINNKSIELYFSQPINSKEINLSNFLFDDENNPSTVVASSEYSYLITSNNSLNSGLHTISIKDIRDYYNTPFKNTTLSFEIFEDSLSFERLFITNHQIIDNYNLSITFNYKLDSLTALNKSNYIFIPNNILEHIDFFNQSQNTLILKTSKPFGAVGKEYVLRIQNIFSSFGSGSIPINENSGSEIVLTANAKNLDDIFVYPNPVKIESNQSITFANLTNRVEIYIYSIDGMFINKIVELDGNGGVDWNLLDQHNNKVGSGIYIYKAISLDNFDKTLQEKIGKFAVIK